MNIWTDVKHKEWRELAKRTEPFIDRLTGRDDIYAIVTPDLRSPDDQKEAPRPAGAFTPSLAQIQFTPNLIFDPATTVSVADVDPCAPVSQRQYPKYVGVTVHEASHGRHSTYILPPLEGRVMEWCTLIEEPRCEKWLLEDFPQYAIFIKSMVAEVIGGKEFLDGKGMDKAPDEIRRRYQAGRLCFLIMARGEYGVYEDGDLDKCERVLRDTLGDADYEAMNDIWLEALEIADDEMEEIIALAERTQKIIDPNNELEQQEQREGAGMPCGASMPQSGDDEGDSQSGQGSSAGGSSAGGSGDEDEDDSDDDSDGDSDGDGSGKDGKDKSDKKGKGGSGDSDDDSDDADGDNGDKLNGKGGTSKNDEILKAIIDDLKEKGDDAKEEIKQFGKVKGMKFKRDVLQENADHRAKIKKAAGNIQAEGSGAGYSMWGRPLYMTKVQPNAKDIARARAIEDALRKAQYRDVTKTQLKSMVPPGRLSMRGVMNREAQVAARQEITATPWSQTRRRTVDNPPITLAIASDISGSMSAYQREVGSFSWAFAHAVRRLQGSVGAVAWDNMVHEFIQPNLATKEVHYYADGGASNGLPDAISAVDGMMDLSFKEGVRVLAIITDGELPNNSEVQKRIDELHNYGVIVLWILTSSRGFKPNNAHHAVLNSPSEFGNVVGRKVIEVLSQA